MAERTRARGQWYSPTETKGPYDNAGWTAVIRIAQSGAGSSVALSLARRFDDFVTIEHLRPILTVLRGDYPQLLDRNGTHSKFSNTPENVALLQRMQRLGTVKTFSESGSYLKANMRRLSA